jgi:hypothetical protein
MKIRLFLTVASFAWGSAMATAEEYRLDQVNRPINSVLEQVNKQDELAATRMNKPIGSPLGQLKKPIESPLARSQRCARAECGLIPSDIAGHEP